MGSSGGMTGGSFLIEIRILFGRIFYLVYDLGFIPIEFI